ncbi:MAG: response regulator [bacterium]|nr:response regulator [bacterium]
MGNKELRKILLVNNNQKTYTQLKRFLSDNRYEVCIVNNEKNALQMLKNIPVDIVLLDIITPDISSMKYLGDIKKNYKGIPVIITARGKDEEIAQKFMESGAFAYLSDPIDFQQLLDCIEIALFKRE